MREIMRYTPPPCAATPSDAAIRAMTTAQLGELIDDLLERAPLDADEMPILDATTGPLFDAAWAEVARRMPIMVEVEFGHGDIA